LARRDSTAKKMDALRKRLLAKPLLFLEKFKPPQRRRLPLWKSATAISIVVGAIVTGFTMQIEPLLFAVAIARLVLAIDLWHVADQISIWCVNRSRFSEPVSIAKWRFERSKEELILGERYANHRSGRERPRRLPQLPLIG
jgi:hypothetical protein